MRRRRAFSWLLLACVALASALGSALCADAPRQQCACPVRIGCPTCMMEESLPKTTIVQVGACAPCGARANPAPCAMGGGCTTGCASGGDGSSCNPYRTWSLFAGRKVAACEVCATTSCGTSCGCGCSVPSCGCQANVARPCHPRPILDALTRLTGRDR